MEFRYLLIAIIFTILAGCSSAGTIPDRPAPIETHICWDGSVVDDVTQCPTSPTNQQFTCLDGRVVINQSYCTMAQAFSTCVDGTEVYNANYCPREVGENLRTQTLHWSNYKVSHPPYEFSGPATTMKDRVPREYFVENEGSLPSLLDVFVKIETALENHSPEYSYKVYSYKNGFAILTDDELIDKNGKTRLSKSDARLLPDRQNKYGFFRSLANVFNRPDDRFRYFAFVVSTEDFPSSSETATPLILEKILSEGSTPGALSENILSDYAFTNKYRVEVWVYEFGSSDSINRVRAGTSLNDQPHAAYKFTEVPMHIHKTASTLLVELFR